MTEDTKLKGMKLKKLIKNDPSFVWDYLENQSTETADKFITNLTYEGINAYLKVVFDETLGKKKADNEYNTYLELEDKSHVVPLIGNRPIKIGDFYGTLTKAADNTLDNLIFYEKKKTSEEDIIKIIYEAAKGVAALERIGKLHRDIKISNIFFYKDLGWVISDLGNSGDEKRFETETAKNDHMYWSPTAQHHNNDERKKYIYTHSEDIWQLGLTFFLSLKKEKTPSMWDDYKEARSTEKSLSYQEFVYREIEKSKFSSRTKNFLMKLMGAESTTGPESLPKGRIVMRYKNISEFIDEYEGKKVTSVPPKNMPISNYHRAYNKLKNLIDNVNKHDYSTGDFGTLNYSMVNELVNAKDTLVEIANKDSLKGNDERNNTFYAIKQKYDDIVSKERNILISALDNMPKEIPANDTQLRSLYEIMFLWGPPLRQDIRLEI
jgi:serine/threonine protein kinase